MSFKSRVKDWIVRVVGVFCKAVLILPLAPACALADVTVLPPSVQGGAGTVVLPDGSQLSCAGTQTACLQEAVNKAVELGERLVIKGRHVQSDDVNEINKRVYFLNQTLNIPPTKSFDIKADATAIIHRNPIGCSGSLGCVAIQIDSAMASSFRFEGQINAPQGTSVLLRPTGNVPVDCQQFGACVVTTASDFYFGHLGGFADAVNGSKFGVVFDPALGSFDANSFTCKEVWAREGGIRVSTPGAGLVFRRNRVTCADVHGQTTGAAIDVGVGPTNASFISGNWFSFGVAPACGAIVGISVWGQRNELTMNLIDDQCQGSSKVAYGFIFQASATYNRFRALVNEATTAVLHGQGSTGNVAY